MKGRKLLLVLLLIFSKVVARAQTDTTARNGCMCLSYNNDTFTYTDRYYTHGFRVELSHRSIAKFPTRYVLLRMRRSNLNFYGLSLVQDAFTPSSIKREHIHYGDRPYAAYAYAGAFLISENTQRKLRITTELDAGVIGPGACGYEVQSEFHRMIGDKHPEGWNNQVSNDLVLNYRLKVEKGLLAAKRGDVTLYSEVNAGTLYTNAISGLELRSGQLGSWSYNANAKWKAYLFGRAQVKAVGYNATLQGGLFNSDDRYVLSGDLIERFVSAAQAGIVLAYKKIGVEYGYVFQEKELRYGLRHGWGHAGINIGL